jgi:TolA-binding protein
VFEAGVEIEDGLRYDEPEPLGFSIRHWLGDALWEAERHEEAIEVFQAELLDHPNNGWSLFGLERSLRALGKDHEANSAHEQFLEAWARSDTYIRSPIF